MAKYRQISLNLTFYWTNVFCKYFIEALLTCLSHDYLCYSRDRPAAYTPDVKSITDTSNFDEFPDVDLKIGKYCRVLQL